MKEYKENSTSDISGTVIDIETVGPFSKAHNDSRRYCQIKPVIFGYIDRKELKILCAGNASEIEELNQITTGLLKELEKPFYAFNCEFETCVLFHTLGLETEFSRELNSRKYERKGDVVMGLGISNYDDPFFDNGLMCSEAWQDGDIEKAIAHNRACLLKERDILLNRGYRSPDRVRLVRV